MSKTYSGEAKGDVGYSGGRRYGSAGAVQYASRLTICSPDGGKLCYEQALSIPYSQGQKVNGDIADIVKQYGRHRKQTSARYPLALQYGKNPQSLGYTVAGTDGANHADRYNLATGLMSNMLANYIETLKQKAAEPVGKKKEYDQNCEICGVTVLPGQKICSLCMNGNYGGI